MTEHKQVELWLEKAEDTIDYAQRVFADSQRVEVEDTEDYVGAQVRLEEVNNHLEVLLRVATPAQRDQLNRTQQQVRQLQNHFILKQ